MSHAKSAGFQLLFEVRQPGRVQECENVGTNVDELEHSVGTFGQGE